MDSLGAVSGLMHPLPNLLYTLISYIHCLPVAHPICIIFRYLLFILFKFWILYSYKTIVLLFWITKQYPKWDSTFLEPTIPLVNYGFVQLSTSRTLKNHKWIIQIHCISTLRYPIIRTLTKPKYSLENSLLLYNYILFPLT